MAKRKKKQKGLWKKQVFLIVGILSTVMFSALAVIVAVGMIPTFVAAIVDQTAGKMRTLTIGAINFAGCAPFMMEVFHKGNNIEIAINYIIQPRTIVVIYFAAAMGYLIDWAMTGIVSSIMVQKSKSRLGDIKKEQGALVERWGQEVTGSIPLDEYGFPKEDYAPEAAKE